MPIGKMSDMKMLSVIFKRNNFLRGDKSQPKFNGKNNEDHYVEYVYSIPLGLTVGEGLVNAIGAAFEKPVKVLSEGGRIFIRIYFEKLPEIIPYSNVPIRKSAKWLMPIGYGLDGWLWHDLDRDAVHMNVSGATRQGKTVFLKNLITYLCEHKTDYVKFHLIDMKGGLEFGRYENLRQVEGVASNIEEAEQMLERIRLDIDKKMKFFKRRGFNNIVNTPIRTRHVIIIDEAAELTPDKHTLPKLKESMQNCQDTMSHIARVAGALGYRLVFCTQYATADTLPRQVKQNSDAKIAFKLPTGTASRVAIDEDGAQYLPNAGRAIYKTHERETVQVPLLDDKEMMERLQPFMKEVSELDAPKDYSVPETDGSNIIEFGKA